jgi:hypothetical protein
LQKKIPIHIVYVTSSDLNGISNKTREKESLKVLRKLGVKKNQISFVGKELFIPDLRLKDHFIKAFIRCKKLLQKLGNVGTIYSLAYEGGHPDHDALNFLCSKLILFSKTKIIGWQFPLYSGPGLFGSLFYLFRPLKKNGNVKKKKIDWKNIKIFLKLIFIYKSQFKTFFGLYPFYFIHMVFKRNSVIQKINPYKTYNRPHKGKLLYERRGMDEFKKLKLKMNKFELYLEKTYNSI